MMALLLECSCNILLDDELKKEIWQGLDLLQEYLSRDNIVEVDE